MNPWAPSRRARPTRALEISKEKEDQEEEERGRRRRRRRIGSGGGGRGGGGVLGKELYLRWKTRRRWRRRSWSSRSSSRAAETIRFFEEVRRALSSS